MAFEATDWASSSPREPSEAEPLLHKEFPRDPPVAIFQGMLLSTDALGESDYHGKRLEKALSAVARDAASPCGFPGASACDSLAV